MAHAEEVAWVETDNENTKTCCCKVVSLDGSKQINYLLEIKAHFDNENKLDCKKKVQFGMTMEGNLPCEEHLQSFTNKDIKLQEI